MNLDWARAMNPDEHPSDLEGCQVDPSAEFPFGFMATRWTELGHSVVRVVICNGSFYLRKTAKVQLMNSTYGPEDARRHNDAARDKAVLELAQDCTVEAMRLNDGSATIRRSAERTLSLALLAIAYDRAADTIGAEKRDQVSTDPGAATISSEPSPFRKVKP